MERKNKKMKKNKSEVNLICALMTGLFLTLAVTATDVTFTTRIKNISSDLGRALNKILIQEDVVYSNFTDNATYIANVQYNPKGMAGLYNITHWFMDIIQPKEVFPKDFELTNNEGKIDLQKIIEQWPSLLKHYAGLLALTILGLLFAVLMPFIGFIFCCCRCCGNCGARSQPFDKKHDMCRKVFLAMFLIAVATLILFGVVCAFVSNQHMQEGTEELPKNLRDSLVDVSTYIDSTNGQINVLLIQNYQELKSFMHNLLNNSTTIITDELYKLSKAVSFSKLETFVQGLDDIKTNLASMQNATRDLRIKASQLNDGLRRVKHELLHTLQNCSNKRYKLCSDINAEVAKLGTTVDFDSLPDVTNQINDLNTYVTEDLINKTKEGNEKFHQIPSKINDTVVTSIPEIEKALNAAGEKLKEASVKLGKTLNNVNKTIDKNAQRPIDDAEKLIKKYSIYRYYVGLAVSSILLLVILCVTFGLMCGICGKRPDGYDDDCCNKGAGSKFLMLGVAIMFLFSIVLMAVTLVYFLSGVIIQRFACDTLRNPKDNPKLFDLIDKQLNLEETLHTDIVTIITECHAKKSAYQVLRLDYQFNVSRVPELLEEYNVTQKIKEFQDKINFNETIKILDDDTKNKVLKLGTSSVSNLPIHRFLEILENNLTSIDLGNLANELVNVYSKLSTKEGAEHYAMSIKQNEMYLRMYQSQLVEPMVDIANDMKNKAQSIEESLKFNHSSFEEAINATLFEVETAQDYININGSTDMKNLAKEFGASVESKINFYVTRIANLTAEDVGRCGPLSNVYDNMLISGCDKILNPWNGFWISVGSCLILFIPTIILSVKLSTLYQKSDPYPGPLFEHEYLYDAYADRDNIPLSNASGKKGKKKKKHRSEVYEARGYQGPSEGPRITEARAAPRERDAPGGSSHPDTRYADMAPKHWEDYPNGGPPQYQSAPLATEYERPPPYYYPGPGDRP